MRFTPSYEENLKRERYGSITAPGSPPMSIIQSSLSTGDRLQQVKENHPSKTCDGVS